MTGRSRIIIVEDDRDSLLGLSVFLKKAGFEVLTAEDALQAIGVIRNAKPDLVILDLGLPAGGGEFVLKRIRDDVELFATPVIIVSAHRASDHKELMDRFNVAQYFEKPARAYALLAAIESALQEDPATIEIL